MIVLTVLLAVALFGAVAATQLLVRHQAKVVAAHSRVERQKFYGKLLTLLGGQMKSVSFDYTFWDEMVRYVRRPNRAWASSNIDTALSTYDVDGLWICDPAMRPVHSALRPEVNAFTQLPVPPAALKWIRSAGPYYHFMVMTSLGPMEIMGASIHGSDDAAHTGPAQGYLFVGRVYSKDYLSEIGAATSSIASLGTPSRPGAKRDPYLMEFDLPMIGWYGKPVANLKLVSVDETDMALKQSSIQYMLTVGSFLFVLLFVIGWFLYVWVTRPLGLLSAALRRQEVGFLSKLKGQAGEMGLLARLIHEFFEQETELKASYDLLDERVKERTVELAQANKKLEAAYDATIEGLARALDLRDRETEGHSRRVAEMTLVLARSMGIPEEELEHYKRGALLHDIGKMGISDAILLKPEPLSDDDWQQMRLHPQFAAEMLGPIAFLHPSIDIPYYHHEKWDGTGYPHGLAGEAIPLSARIFAIVDVWDALSSDRPYRRAWPLNKVRRHIGSLSGSHFDPKVVDAMLEMMDADVFLSRAA
jgi:putative nucleotidyltransferase with HDIG domain